MKAFWRTLVSQVGSLFGRKGLDARMAEEMRCHLEELTRANVEAGMGPEEARYAALRRFGGVAQIEERCRDAHGFSWLWQLLKDLRFAARSLYGAWGYTLTILFTLVLGIGATTLVYNISGWMIFHSSPFPHSEQLFFVGYRDKQHEAEFYRPGLFLKAYREQAGAVGQFAASGSDRGNVVLDGEPVPTYAMNVTADEFDMLGIRPVLGRGFLPGEGKEGADGVAIISDRFWKEHFGGLPDVLGRKVLIDQKVCAVVGVLAKDQALPYFEGGDLFRPLVLKLDPQRPFQSGIFIIARLKPGVTRDQALAALAAVKVTDLPAWATSFFSGEAPVLSNIEDLSRHDMWWVILAAGAFLYMIACLNAMNLMLIRLIGRRRELSIRFAVGGSRWQVLQVLLAECLLLAASACVIAIILVHQGLPLVMEALYGSNYSIAKGFWNWGEIKVVAGLSAATCVLTAIAPIARLWRTDAGSGLKDGGAATGESRRASRFRTSLVVLQAAFAVVLLVGTGLMVRSFSRLQRLDLGFDPVGKVKVRVQFPPGYDPNPDARLQLFERLQESLGRLPGVRAVSFAEDALLSEGAYVVANLKLADGTTKEMHGSFVAADFQKAGGLVMKRGRWLSGKRGQFEIVVNEKLARALFGGLDPLGRSVSVDTDKQPGKNPCTVVGVVGNVRLSLRAAASEWFYLPAWQQPQLVDTFVLRLDREPVKEFAGLVRKTIYGTDQRLNAFTIQSIGQQIDDTMWAEREVYTMLKGLAVVALGLTVIGLFSVISFTVDSRMTEFGVRLAVGACAADLVRMVLGRGLGAAAAGTLFGVAGAMGLTRFMQRLLFETKPFDPFVYMAVAVLLLAAAVTACWLPARRAARVDVMKLLRSD